MTAPKIDTQAPERVWAYVLPPSQNSGRWTGEDIYTGTTEYERRDLADARAAAAWIAGRDALANHISAMMTRCAEANDKAYPTYAEDMRDWATDVTNEAGDLHPPTDTAALDRLIAERVREAVDRALRDAVAICKKVRNENAENEDQAVGALDCAVSIMDEVNRRARGSKEGRDG